MIYENLVGIGDTLSIHDLMDIEELINGTLYENNQQNIDEVLSDMSEYEKKELLEDDDYNENHGYFVYDGRYLESYTSLSDYFDTQGYADMLDGYLSYVDKFNDGDIDTLPSVSVKITSYVRPLLNKWLSEDI